MIHLIQCCYKFIFETSVGLTGRYDRYWTFTSDMVRCGTIRCRVVPCGGGIRVPRATYPVWMRWRAAPDVDVRHRAAPYCAASIVNEACCSHAHVPLSVTMQDNLVPVTGLWCRTLGKITVSLASFWLYGLRYRLKWLIHLWTQGLSKGDQQPAYTPL